MTNTHIFIAAGEVSGDLLGADLMAALKTKRAEIVFSGIGGDSMMVQDKNFTSLFDMADLSVFGIFPVLAQLPNIIKRMVQTINHICDTKPDVIVLIDNPDFMHFLAKRIRRRLPATPIICYVAPQIWAWRRGRAHKMKDFCDAILALLPFEPQVYQANDGPPCHFVGHSVATRYQQMDIATDFRTRHNIAARAPLLCVLPGSRAAEVKRLTPIFGRVIKDLATRIPDLEICMPLVPHVAAQIKQHTNDWALQPHFTNTDKDKWAAFRASDAALAASGTVTLELTMTQTPMVVAYDMGNLTNFFALRIMQTPSVVLTNLILDKPLIKEFLGYAANVAAITPEIYKLLTDTTHNKAMRTALAPVQDMLLPATSTPAQAAADIVLKLRSSVY